MEYIEIDKKIFLQVFQYEDIEAFTKVCERSQEANYFAIKKIWNPGIEVILVYKRFGRIISNNIGFISMIDCERLSNNEKKMVSLLGVPKKYKGFLLMI